MEPKNRFGLPVQAGEFIHIQNGEAHILNYVEEWPDAPETTSGYRGVDLYGLYIGTQELRNVAISERGFSELESRFKQSICEEPVEQDVFDVWIDGANVDEFIFKPITTSKVLNGNMEDGCYFVIFARGTLYTSEICQIQSDWTEYKIQQKLAKPEASVAAEWASEWLKKHPELDAPWIENDILTTISCIEEPSEWKGEQHPFVGRKVFIRRMKGEPQYSGREGTVTYVDDCGQIHGTWGGCALTLEDDFSWLGSGPDPDHYNDGMIDVRNIPDFNLIVFTSNEGDTKTVGYDDNFFHPSCLLGVYRSLWKKTWNMDNELPDYVNRYKEYLLKTGCSPEDLEEDS